MRYISFLISACLVFGTFLTASAQELNAKVTINHQQIQGTSVSVFENLEKSLTAFLNERQWTNLQFNRNERINCNFNIQVTKYDEAANTLECTLTLQSQRPVFNAAYTTTVFAVTDANFNFIFREFDQLDFRADVIDNDLTALAAYYAYLIIGWDLDTMSPLGGTDVLKIAQTITNNAQNLQQSSKGWQAFADSKNRYAIINDYLEGGMEAFRQMQYKYYREGMDIMAENAERGRAAITEAIELLNQAHKNKPMCMLPQMFTDFKHDELVNIYKGKGTGQDKESVYETLMGINASLSRYWNQLK